MIPAEEYLKLTPEERAKLYNMPLCCDCKKSIVGDEIRRVAEGSICDDCYFIRFGKEIDEHPIGR
jgi:hypothetical protein